MAARPMVRLTMRFLCGSTRFIHPRWVILGSGVSRWLRRVLWLWARLWLDFGELGGNFRGLRRGAPARCVAAVAPGPRPVEGVDAEFVHLLHLVHPGGMHPISMVVGRLADLRQPQPAVEGFLGDLLGAFPHVGLVDDIADAVAGEGELAGQMVVLVLVDH